MIIFLTVGDVVFGKRLEAWDLAKKIAACAGSVAFTPASGSMDKILFSGTYDSLAAFEEHVKKPNPKYEALLKENRERHLLDNSVRYIYEELK
jgi:hypothetical protein